MHGQTHHQGVGNFRTEQTPPSSRHGSPDSVYVAATSGDGSGKSKGPRGKAEAEKLKAMLNANFQNDKGNIVIQDLDRDITKS